MTHRGAGPRGYMFDLFGVLISFADGLVYDRMVARCSDPTRDPPTKLLGDLFPDVLYRAVQLGPNGRR